MKDAIETGRLRAVYDRVAGRYDLQHGLLTGGSDQRGRRLLVERAVRTGERVLDCGAGTGSTALLALERVGPEGRVVLFDLSEGMLAIAKERLGAAADDVRAEFRVGDMLDLPFEDHSFDVVLSTYSLCPVVDPARGARELYRVTRPGGRIGIAHSAEPRNRFARWLAHGVEAVVWRLPSVSLGCRPVSVLPALEEAGCNVLFQRQVGVPLWPFFVFVAEKPLGVP